MSLTIARLRQAILVLAGLLVAVIIGFFFYARHRLRSLEKDLPAKLGVNIQQTANGYTYSQSSKGHTVYTIHASKLIQYKEGGNAMLHDVAITLYGPPGSNRVDKISGSDFSYDAKDQIVSAQGTVMIDLQGFGTGADAASPRNTIHVKTSGLVFNQKTGQADTNEHTEFAFPKASGSSTGAHYNSKTGMLVLDSQVEMITEENGNPAVLLATHAQVDRDSKRAFLSDPRTEFQSEKGSSDTAVVSFRPDGSAQTIDAKGHVHVITADGSLITAATSTTELNDKSQLTQSEMNGGVNFVSTTPSERMIGSADSGTLTFGENSLLKHAQFRGGVSFAQQISGLSGDPAGTASRQIEASKLDMDFVPGPDGKNAIAQKALATGNAQVNLQTVPSREPRQATTIAGEQLLALFTPDGKAIRQLNGDRQTKVVDLAKDGSTNTSTGDRLQVLFALPKPAPGGRGNRTASAPRSNATGQAVQIETAVQDGNVILTQTPKEKPGAKTAPSQLTAWAQHAEYHASDQILHLSGSPRLYDGQGDGQALQMAADRIDYHRDSGDANAEGDVKATETQAKAPGGAPIAGGGPALGGSGPVHITADRALVRHSTGVSTFYGTGATDARMWQGANSILAPVIELNRNPETLRAYGVPGSIGPVVKANLTSATASHRQQDTARIKSRTLFYSDADRRGDFKGEVTAEDSQGVIHADEAQVYLTPAPAKGQKENQQAQVERIVATGHVVLTQPGRNGTGEMLVYTADDGRYVLTGAPGKPPRVEDAVKGTTTGSTLIFNSQDDSVVVSGGQSSAVTETRVQDRSK